MNSESRSIESATKKCAKQFAAWLMHSPELETWEDRKDLVFDLNRVAERMEREGRFMSLNYYHGLPSLSQASPEKIMRLAAWTETAMAELNLSPPEWEPEQSRLEKVQELVDLLCQAAIPLEPSEFR